MMKKFTFLLVATCFAFSTFAQGIVTPTTPKSETSISLTKRGAPAQSPKANTIYYTSQFNGGCASITDPVFYSFNGGYGPVTGTNAYGDQGFAQQFHFSTSVSVVGVAAYLIKVEGDDATLKALAMDASYNELASANYQASSVDTNGALYQYTFNTPINVQDVLVGVTVPEYTETGSIVALGTTEVNCTSDLNKFYKGYIDETTVAWQNMTAGVEDFFVDFFVFPITSGTVSITDLDQLTAVYPNPSNDNVTVMSSVKINTVEIFNVMGQMVYTSNVNDNATTINVSDFATGAYIVKMNTESGSINKKLMVK